VVCGCLSGSAPPPAPGETRRAYRRTLDAGETLQTTGSRRSPGRSHAPSRIRVRPRRRGPPAAGRAWSGRGGKTAAVPDCRRTAASEPGRSRGPCRDSGDSSGRAIQRGRRGRGAAQTACRPASGRGGDAQTVAAAVGEGTDAQDRVGPLGHGRRAEIPRGRTECRRGRGGGRERERREHAGGQCERDSDCTTMPRPAGQRKTASGVTRVRIPALARRPPSWPAARPLEGLRTTLTLSNHIKRGDEAEPIPPGRTQAAAPSGGDRPDVLGRNRQARMSRPGTAIGKHRQGTAAGAGMRVALLDSRPGRATEDAGQPRAAAAARAFGNASD
jgi:hypothetical protein